MGGQEHQEAVGVVRTSAGEYASVAPFDPDQSYPELPWRVQPSGHNPAYEGVRRLFQVLSYDAGNFGSQHWNPLGWLIRPGDTVLLKPNLIKESHPRDPEGWRYVLTHGSFLRAVADYVCIALAGRGRIVICDAPQTDSSFVEICRVLGIDRLRAYYGERGMNVDLLDLRQEEWEASGGAVVRRRSLPGDPAGNLVFNLGKYSELSDHAGQGRYYGADYDLAEVNAHHSCGKHEYSIPRTVIEADVLINLPKLKTHKKTGITAALKNLVGINADKNWLPHHTQGHPAAGGDEFPDSGRMPKVERAVLRVLRDLALRSPALGGRLLGLSKTAGRPIFGDSRQTIRAGNWYGNDTTWRMCLDLNRILFYGRSDGTLVEPGTLCGRRYLALVDGIVAGEGNGPLDPDPVVACVVLGGANPVAVDTAAAILSGFDPDKIPLIANAFRCQSYPLATGRWDAFKLVSDVDAWNGRLGDIDPSDCFHFKPHFGWEGHIEREPAAVSR